MVWLFKVFRGASVLIMSCVKYFLIEDSVFAREKGSGWAMLITNALIINAITVIRLYAVSSTAL